MTLEEQIQEKLLHLEEALLQELPEMPTILAVIHKELAQQPQLIQALTDEQIATITKGLSVYTQTKITTSPTKKRKPSLKNVSVLDLC